MLGIFDSGIGGLNVLREIRQKLPQHSVMYLGDNARTPYGNRSRDVVTKYTKECCLYLFEKGCNLIVLACNTASADTLRELQQEWLPSIRNVINRSINILGVIRPVAEEAVTYIENNRVKRLDSRHAAGRIGVVGTRSTVESETYVKELKKLKPEVEVIQKSCPLLVPLVEEGWQEKPEARKILRTYIASLKSANPDVLILGCTHYEGMHSLFAHMMGRQCRVLHTPLIVADKLVDYLERHPEYEIPQTGEIHFMTTGDPERFSEVGSRFFKSQINGVQSADMLTVGHRAK